MKTRPTQKGFTLIELAVVIAIIAILAAVAIPRFANVTGQAERAKAADLTSNLTSAAAIYTAAQAASPNGFTDFVQNAGTAVSPFTISLQGINNGMTGAGATPCATAGLNNINACRYSDGNSFTYTWNNGAITCNWVNGASNPTSKANGPC